VVFVGGEDGTLYARANLQTGWTPWINSGVKTPFAGSTFWAATPTFARTVSLYTPQASGFFTCNATSCQFAMSGAGAFGCPTACSTHNVPAAVQTSSTWNDYFQIGSDNAIWERVSKNGGISAAAPWSKVAPEVAGANDPSYLWGVSATSTTSTTIQVFARGTGWTTPGDNIYEIDFDPRPPGT
jgi:hypothetical protein